MADEHGCSTAYMVHTHPLSSRSRNRGYLLCLGGVFLWSTTAVILKYTLATYTITPLALAFWRNVFASVALACALGLLRPKALQVARRDVFFLLLYGASLAAMNLSWILSVALNGAAVSTILIYSSPGITVIASRVLFKEPLSTLTMCSLVLTFAGCMLVVGWKAESQLSSSGTIIGAISAISFSAYSLLGKMSLQRGIGPWSGTLYAFGVATVLLAIPQQGNIFVLAGRVDGWCVVVLLAIIPTLGGFGLFTASLEYLPAGAASVITSLEPALATMVAYCVLQESLLTTQLVGCGVIVVGVATSQWNWQREAAGNSGAQLSERQGVVNNSAPDRQTGGEGGTV